MNQKAIFNISICTLLFAAVFTGAATVTADEWPMFHHDPQHTGYSTSTAPDTNNIMWTHTIGNIMQSSPAFGKGRLYIGSENGDLYCFDAEPSEGTDEGTADPAGSDYDLIWRFTSGGSILSSPAFYDGKIYFGSNDGKIYCIYACIGIEVWNYTTGDAVSSSPTITNGKVYIGSQDGNMYCLDAMTGDHLWEYPIISPVYSSPAVTDGRVYIGACNAKLYCLYASNGSKIWEFPVNNDIYSSPTVVDNKVYFGELNGQIYSLHASNGTEIWSNTTDDITLSSPAIFNDNIYIGSTDGGIYCFNATNGEKTWEFQTNDEVWSSPAVADGKVYVGSNDGNVYCLDASNGTELWRYWTGNSVSSSPAILNMRAYVASENGNIYCFRDHNPPRIPDKPDGPTEGIARVEYTFTSDTVDPERDEIYYMFDWGDDTQSEWLGPFDQHETVNATHKWYEEGYYTIMVRAKDSYGYISDWSENVTIHISILEISNVRGGLGIHAEIKNVGSRKLWRLQWSISIVGGMIQNPSTREIEGSILGIACDETEMVETKPFFEIGRIKITVTVSDIDTDNSDTKTVNGFAFGYLILLSR